MDDQRFYRIGETYMHLRSFYQISFFLVGALCFVSLTGCGTEKLETILFERVSSNRSGVEFSNRLTYSDALNIYSYNNFYAGGGVALADYDGDGRLDIYLVSNQSANRLYLNRGEFTFEDVTEQSGAAGSFPWSTGVSIVDINTDGFPDLYVTNAGASQAAQRANELFINNGDGTFTERAQEYGLADQGYSIHASFFDYDQDGFLDVYVVNNFPSRPISEYDPRQMDRSRPYFEGGDRLYRNVQGRFVEVTKEAGIFSSEAGFSLGASAADLNRDGCMDLYVSNDFFERDYLYINQCDGTFQESLERILSSISTTSMSGDIADLDNDGAPEIFISDMLPATKKRIKRISNFIGWEQYRQEIQLGYHHKFLRNTLHYNNGDGTFSEIGRYAGVEATDWSWGGLLADFDLDGLRDIFVTNGFYKDVTDKDLLMASTQLANTGIGGRDYVRRIVDRMPSTPVSNHIFENLGKLQFADRSSDWGVDTPGFSSGAAYGDLDLDGDLDLVVNNVNMEAFVYRNQAVEQYPERAWIGLELQGEASNPYGIGAQVEAIYRGKLWYTEQMPQRGFQSSVDPVIHVGLGEDVSVLDTVRIRWPDGRISIQTQVETRRRIPVRQEFAFWPQTAAEIEWPRSTDLSLAVQSQKRIPLLTDVTREIDLDWKHRELPHNDFEDSPLLFHMRSTEGPPLCSMDINADQRDDFFVGGGRGQPGALFMHDPGGKFRKTYQPILEEDRQAEDIDCVWVDVNSDQRPELYVASGSSELPVGHPDLADRLYTLNAEGTLELFEHALPESSYRYSPTATVRPADVDQDGDQDLFIGVRQGATYGEPVGGILLENDGTGRFQDATRRIIPEAQASELNSAGITGVEWGDLDQDGQPDLVVVGEWMPLTIFFNRDGILERAELESTRLSGTSGWWQSVTLSDINADGALDIIAGNQGLNTRFKADEPYPVEMWVHDFIRDGQPDQIITGYDQAGGPWPFASREQLLQYFGLSPFIARKNLGLGRGELEQIFQRLPHLAPLAEPFEAYAEKTVHDLFGSELNSALRYSVERLETVVAWNQRDGTFRVEPLPFRSQLTPMYATLTEDLDGDGTPEILMGGNLYGAMPQAGRYDAGYGVVLRLDSTGEFIDLPAMISGFHGVGEIRSLEVIRSGDESLIAAAFSGGSLAVFRPSHYASDP